MEKYLTVISEFQKLQSQLSNLWQAIQTLSDDINPSERKATSTEPVAVNSPFPKKGTWYHQIEFVIKEAGIPLSAKEITERLAILREETTEVIQDRVNTNCSTMRQEGLIGFVPNYPGSQRGKYCLIEWSQSTNTTNYSINNKTAQTEEFDDFKKWLPNNGVIAGADSYIGRIHMFENRIGNKLYNILATNGIEKTLEKTEEKTFDDLSRGTINDIKTAIRRYNQFLDSAK